MLTLAGLRIYLQVDVLSTHSANTIFDSNHRGPAMTGNTNIVTSAAAQAPLTQAAAVLVVIKVSCGSNETAVCVAFQPKAFKVFLISGLSLQIRPYFTV